MEESDSEEKSSDFTEEAEIEEDLQEEYTIEDNAIEDTTGNVECEGKVLSNDQMKVYNTVLEGESVLITGAGGVGKSLLILAIVKYLSATRKSNEYGVTSTTGCSSLLIGGCTLHSFLKIGLAKFDAQTLFNKLSAANKYRLSMLKVLIIDEVSMLDRTLFEKVNSYLRLVKYNTKPFGGVQLILSGDMAQLSPVDSSGYCFKSPVWEQTKFKIFNLTKSFRQSDKEFVTILNSIRMGKCTNAIFNRLEKLRDTKFPDEVVPVKLLSINSMVDFINGNKLKELALNNTVYDFPVLDMKGSKAISAAEMKKANIPTEFSLCVNCQVMVTFNIEPSSHIVNGTMGTVKRINIINSLRKSVDILVFTTGQMFTVNYITYRHQDMSGSSPIEKTLFSYMPLTIAYATTIHKSQGKTIDFLEIDLGNTVFANGQAYTALSRAKKIENIKLTDLSKRSFKCDPIVKKFYEDIE
jgi:ATP-dependent DNA helicase PIF1